jgi:TatD DNase family protein
MWAKADMTPAQIIGRAADAGVTKIVCIGCSLSDSEVAVQFAQDHPECWVSIGLHPHEAQHYAGNDAQLAAFAELATKPRVVAVGECGLDYYYEHSPRVAQIEVLRFQMELALQHDLPMVFHVRDAFDDFWPIFDSYAGIRGVIHSFSAGVTDVEQIIARGLYVGLNGIMTFTKHDTQLAAAKAVPLDRLVLETDAPFLTPSPERGKVCEPKHLRLTAEFLAQLRGETIEQLAAATTHNAAKLFGI